VRPAAPPKAPRKGGPQMTKRILVVDDEIGVREALELLLEERGYLVATAARGSDALGLLAGEGIDLVLSDVAMPGMDGIELVERIKAQKPELPVIMISAHGELETAVRAVRAGAYDYLLKPLDEDRLFHTLEKALEYSRLNSDYRILRQESRAGQDLLGDSPVMRTLREQIERAAPSDSRILILGENGTGKELVARQIHELSQRSSRPFIKVNSAAIPKDLIESELFGHEAGAFTGAAKARKGKFELADGGTLFLDEIGDMATEAQAKLLRVLSTNEIERVGGAGSVPVDVRLVSASNRDLPEEIRRGGFREDLYHRIAVIPILVPPLRERSRDVELMAEHFLKQFSAGYRHYPPVLEPEARIALQRYPWPGNVRELRNLMERIAIMHPGAKLGGTEIEEFLGGPSGRRGSGGAQGGSGEAFGHMAGSPAPGPADARNPQRSDCKGPAADSAAAGSPLRSRMKHEERTMLESTLQAAGWNVTLAAERLGIDRASLHRKMRKLGIRRPGCR
jgi:two-component system, NtrC family, nitrogen regulation response regulator NtrX